MSDLPTRLLKTRDRVRDVILPQYENIGPPAFFAIRHVIKPALEKADRALTSHDAALMISALKDLEGIKE